MKREELEQILLEVQKPAQYIGGELNSIMKEKEKVDCRLAFCFPDKYEVGMSHLGMKILYSLYNQRENWWCERVFAPDADMEQLMRTQNIPLYGLESLDPIKDFDWILFTLQYEMSYTAVLNMLDLAGLPVRAKDRTALSPIVAAGGPCACNPEPIADFVDLFILGEGEEVNIEITDLYMQAKKEDWSKQQYLKEAAKIGGVYVPSLYDVTYNEDNTIKSVVPNCEQAPAKVKKRIIADLDKVYYPDKFVVPFINIVHDRAMLEVQRGCLRGCRFCQAGFIYRPLRDKHYDTLNQNAHDLCASSGYEELSLTSLSTSDYKEIEPLLDDLLNWTFDEKVSISLPSLRVDNFSKELMEKVSRLKKSGLTFAAEAGTQRLRDVINKNVTEEELMNTCRTAFEGGYTSVKLYFMMGLPTETMEDIEGIANLAQKVVDLYYSLPTRKKGKSVNVSISCACFVPKPFTPFQFEGQDTMELLHEKQKHLLASVKSKKISVSYHDADVSFIEAVLAKGDRRLCDVIEAVWKKGSKLDGWYEYFDPQRWYDAMREQGIDPAFYANRHREYDEVMPWDHLDFCVSKNFLIRENKLARESVTTPQCREKCAGCGASQLIKGECCTKEVVYEREVQPIEPPRAKPDPALVLEQPKKVRLFFTKLDRAKYISHLDMNRCMSRALKRSGLPVWYTGGFNPHMYLTFPLPLSLGCESVYECVDLKLTQDVDYETIAQRVNACLPPDIQVFSAGEQKMDQKEIAWADYEICFKDEGGLKEKLESYFNQEQINVIKKTKKGEKEIDLKPYFSVQTMEEENGRIRAMMRFATGIELNINPTLLLDNAPFELTTESLKRVMVYNKQMQPFC